VGLKEFIMKRLLLIVLPLLLIVGCETKISGPVETIPQINGLQLKWIGWGGHYNLSGVYYYDEEVLYVGNKPSFPDDIISDYNNNGWDSSYECTEIELFQFEGYFNYKRPEEPNVTLTRSIGNYTDLMWEEL
jgi:hypothetical protein